MVNPRFLKKAKEWASGRLPEDIIREKPAKIKKNLEELVDFGGVELRRGDRDGIYELFESVGRDPEEFYKSSNDGRIRIESGRVVYLSARDIGLEGLPDSIGNLGNLKEFYVSMNQLKSLPDSIGNLGNLKEFYVSENQLKSIPDSIGNLGYLRGFYVYENQLEFLPDSIGNLKNLERFYVWGNQLQSLPDSIGNLGNLIRLDVERNQLDKKAVELCKRLKGKGVDVRY
jgi:hypothetical protein